MLQKKHIAGHPRGKKQTNTRGFDSFEYLYQLGFSSICPPAKIDECIPTLGGLFQEAGNLGRFENKMTLRE